MGSKKKRFLANWHQILGSGVDGSQVEQCLLTPKLVSSHGLKGKVVIRPKVIEHFFFIVDDQAKQAGASMGEMAERRQKSDKI
jgi:hypothetical protein